MVSSISSPLDPLRADMVSVTSWAALGRIDSEGIVMLRTLSCLAERLEGLLPLRRFRELRSLLEKSLSLSSERRLAAMTDPNYHDA